MTAIPKQLDSYLYSDDPYLVGLARELECGIPTRVELAGRGPLEDNDDFDDEEYGYLEYEARFRR